MIMKHAELNTRIANVVLNAKIVNMIQQDTSIYAVIRMTKKLLMKT